MIRDNPRRVANLQRHILVFQFKLAMDDDFVREVESIVRSEPEKGGVMPRLKRPAMKSENQSPEKGD